MTSSKERERALVEEAARLADRGGWADFGDAFVDEVIRRVDATHPPQPDAAAKEAYAKGKADERDGTMMLLRALEHIAARLGMSAEGLWEDPSSVEHGLDRIRDESRSDAAAMREAAAQECESEGATVGSDDFGAGWRGASRRLAARIRALPLPAGQSGDALAKAYAEGRAQGWRDARAQAFPQLAAEPPADALRRDAEWRERVQSETCVLDAPNGPECWCGRPSAIEVGLCSVHATGQSYTRAQVEAVAVRAAADAWQRGAQQGVDLALGKAPTFPPDAKVKADLAAIVSHVLGQPSEVERAEREVVEAALAWSVASNASTVVESARQDAIREACDRLRAALEKGAGR